MYQEWGHEAVTTSANSKEIDCKEFKNNNDSAQYFLLAFTNNSKQYQW